MPSIWINSAKAKVVPGSIKYNLINLLCQKNAGTYLENLEIDKQIVAYCYSGFQNTKPSIKNLNDVQSQYTALLQYYKNQSKPVEHLDYVYFMRHLHKAATRLLRASYYDPLLKLIKDGCHYLLVLVIKDEGFINHFIDEENQQIKRFLPNDCREFQVLQGILYYRVKQPIKALQVFTELAQSPENDEITALGLSFLLRLLEEGSVTVKNDNLIQKKRQKTYIDLFLNTWNQTNTVILAQYFHEKLTQASIAGSSFATDTLIKYAEHGLIIDNKELVSKNKNPLEDLLKLVSFQGNLFMQNTGLHRLYRILADNLAEKSSIPGFALDSDLINNDELQTLRKINPEIIFSALETPIFTSSHDDSSNYNAKVTFAN